MKGKIIKFFIFIISICLIIYLISYLKKDKEKIIEKQEFNELLKITSIQEAQEKDRKQLNKLRYKCKIVEKEYEERIKKTLLNRDNFYYLQMPANDLAEVVFSFEEGDRYESVFLTLNQVEAIKDIIFSQDYE